MFQRACWDVLLVDDEPDILTISRLALKGLRVYDIPLKIHTCASKAEAIAYLKDGSALPDLALALIDVVMETDTAGLDLCRYIREELRNRVTTLWVRTGQAGMAPEREVMNNWDITGYLAKVEATETKLHSLVMSSVRSFLSTRTLEGVPRSIERLIGKSQTRATLLAELQALLLMPTIDKEGKPLASIWGHFGVIVGGDQYVGLGDYATIEPALKAREELSGLAPRAVNSDGDSVVRKGNKVLLTSGNNADGRPTIHVVGETNFTPLPDYWTRSFMTIMRCFQALWAQAGA